METCGVRTCGELARESVAKLQRHFGEDKGLWLAAMARGRDDDPVKDQSLVQSIGSGKKFEGPHTLKNLTVGLFKNPPPSSERMGRNGSSEPAERATTVREDASAAGFVEFYSTFLAGKSINQPSNAKLADKTCYHQPAGFECEPQGSAGSEG